MRDRDPSSASWRTRDDTAMDGNKGSDGVRSANAIATPYFKNRLSFRMKPPIGGEMRNLSGTDQILRKQCVIPNEAQLI